MTYHQDDTGSNHAGRYPPVLPLAIALIATVIFGSSLSYGFLYDDILHITRNPLIVGTTSLSQALLEFLCSPSPPGNLYRPVTFATYRLTYEIFGLFPLPYHLINVILHIASALLLRRYLLLCSISKGSSDVIALLFVCHPLTVEAVANVAGRAELLAALFGLSALAIAKARSPLSHLRLGTAGVCLLLSMLSKESGIVYAVILPIAMHDSRARSLDAARTLLLSVISIFTALLLRWLVVGSIASVGCAAGDAASENPLCGMVFAERIWPALWVLGDTIVRSLLPLHLSADYSMTRSQLLTLVFSSAGIAKMLLPLLLILLSLLRRNLTSSLFLGWWLLSLLPTINLLFPTGTIMADRLSYTPLMGFIAFLVIHVTSMLGSERLPAGRLLAALFVVFFATQSYQRTQVWSSSAVFYREMVRTAPNSPKAHYNLGVHLFLDEANLLASEVQFRLVLSLDPKDGRAAQALAEIALRREDVQQAEFWLQRAVEIAPRVTRYREQLVRVQEYRSRLR